DVDGAVRQAVRASRGGWILSRTVRGLFGGHVDKSIPMPVTYSHAAVGALIARVRSMIDHPVRNASVSVGESGQLVEVRSRPGATVDSTLLDRELVRALSAPTARHVLSVRVRTVKPKITTTMLAAEYPAYIVI